MTGKCLTCVSTIISRVGWARIFVPTRESHRRTRGHKTRAHPTVLIFALLLGSCATQDNHGTIAELASVQPDIQEVNVEGGLDKAMAGYQKFLEQTPESELTPEENADYAAPRFSCHGG